MKAMPGGGVSHAARPGAQRSKSELSPSEGRTPFTSCKSDRPELHYILRSSSPSFSGWLQVLEALPWEPAVVLKWAAQGGVAVLLSPVADRLVVSPAIHQWVQAKLRSLSS